MPQIAEHEFASVPLRVHALLAGIPLHDVWAVDLPHPRGGITLQEFLGDTGSPIGTAPPIVRALLNARLALGRVFGWDRPEPAARSLPPPFAARLTEFDRARSLAPVGSGDESGSPFRVVYHFENERLDEMLNRTAQAAALSALVETANGYRFYFAVYVKSVGRLTPIYMALIDPARKLIVYPSILRSIRANWDRTFTVNPT